MRIVYLTRKFYRLHGYGGMEKYVWALARHLARTGDEVHVITLPPGAGSKEKNAQMDGIQLHFVHLPFQTVLHSGLQYFLFSYLASKIIARLQPDVVQSFGIGAFFYLRKPLHLRRPVVMQSFGNEWFFHKGVRGLLRAPLKAALRSCMQRCEAIAAETEGQVNEIAGLFDVPNERIFILPDGVDYAAYQDPVGTPVRKKNQKGNVLILNVNRLAPNKGVADFVTAMHLLKEKNTRFRALIVGTGSEEAKILQMIEAYQLTPYVSHLRDLGEEDLIQVYRQADFFVCPTLQEGLPLVLLEALAAGLLVVATRAAQNETVIEDRVNGLLVPPHDPEAIAGALIRLVRADASLHKLLSENAKRTAQAFDWQLISAQARQHYQKFKMNRTI